MRGIKTLLDPRQLMNPDSVLDMPRTAEALTMWMYKLGFRQAQNRWEQGHGK